VSKTNFDGEKILVGLTGLNESSFLSLKKLKKGVYKMEMIW